MTKTLQTPPGYAALLKDIKERVRSVVIPGSLAPNLTDKRPVAQLLTLGKSLP